MKTIATFILGIIFTVCIASTETGRSLHLIEPVIPVQTKVLLLHEGFGYTEIQPYIAPY